MIKYDDHTELLSVTACDFALTGAAAVFVL